MKCLKPGFIKNDRASGEYEQTRPKVWNETIIVLIYLMIYMGVYSLLVRKVRPNMCVYAVYKGDHNWWYQGRSWYVSVVVHKVRVITWFTCHEAYHMLQYIVHTKTYTVLHTLSLTKDFILNKNGSGIFLTFVCVVGSFWVKNNSLFFFLFFFWTFEYRFTSSDAWVFDVFFNI